MKIRLAFAAVLATATCFVLAASVQSHAQLISADPPVGGTVKTPHAISATFDDELTPDGSSLVVQNSGGTQVASGTVSATDDTTMTADLPQLPDGSYTVLWTAISADDKDIERGTYQITVGAAATTEAPSTAATASAGATPAPSATPSQPTGSGSDLLLPLTIVVVVVIGIAGYFIYRNGR